MADRSTAAVDVAHTGGTHPSPSADADEVTTDGRPEGQHGNDSTEPAADPVSAPPAGPLELHSGHKLARRYRLEECVTRLDGFSSWRAVDEKLRRAVGVHVLPAGHTRARPVLAAARSAALLGDPRFVQILDAVEDGDLVYVVHEWLPDAVELTELLASGPLPAHESYQLISQLAQAMAAAHREGLSHLRISPACVLRSASGQYRIRGLAITSALRGVTAESPQRADTEALGALLYAALTQRWPYEQDAYGLSGVRALAKGALIAPDQVRAGVHRGLSDLAMRALVNDGATASSEDPPCTTPEELAKAVSAMPRIRPPEPSFTAPSSYQRTAYPANRYPSDRGPAVGVPAHQMSQPTPPTLPGRTGKALKWGVSALLIAALGLGSWQISDTLMHGDTRADNSSGQGENNPPATGEKIPIVAVKDFDPSGNGVENSETVRHAHDGDPASFWYTQNYYGSADLGNIKPGVGLILDLGKLRDVRSVNVAFQGETSAELLAAPRSTTGMPTSYGAFDKVTRQTGAQLAHQAKESIATQYLLVWLTELPLATDGHYRGRITEIQISG